MSDFLMKSIIGLALLLFITGCTSEEGIDTNVLGEEEILLYVGDSDTEDELLFVMDYSCPWCKVWMDDIYPEVKEHWIDNEKLKFRTQTMVYLNENSLRLTDFDQNVKLYHPELYYDVIHEIMAEAGEEGPENWGSIAYIEDKATQFNLNEKTWSSKPAVDSISVTRRYTRALNIETVPAVFVNGVKVEDPFSLDEIEKLLTR
ncbi:DsbA family protein [Evansella cellulosilytica]|uniref:Thioredoxin-like fold domain-containing protein n=1 Tax=Evansella cellulosilytica (strain ATCC 21833 / DSM 2522 / FERM P-1141 / JCM 9156 / N-4) TaxID=649639 RepID=E6U015_EVAC2|nr:thioredoxin domain-containing protein [Evansella cellulosilytica]ADU29019.1 hypothetical protein Bcell_0738 [Evansella cellulosilytica DSM 2522]